MMKARIVRLTPSFFISSFRSPRNFSTSVISAKELTGASFTISSQGNLGGTYFTPLVNWPQVAILGVSESSIQPRWNETKGEFEPRLMLPLSLSYDHRVINGADAAVFTRYIAKLLADPRRVLL